MEHTITSDCISFQLSPSSYLVEVIKLKNAKFHITVFDWKCSFCGCRLHPINLSRSILKRFYLIVLAPVFYIFFKVLLKYNFFYPSPEFNFWIIFLKNYLSSIIISGSTVLWSRDHLYQPKGPAAALQQKADMAVTASETALCCGIEWGPTHLTRQSIWQTGCHCPRLS